jgi:hypothetical protein
MGHSKRKPVLVTINSDHEDEFIPVKEVAHAAPSLLPKSSAACKCLSTKDARNDWSDEGYVCMKSCVVFNTYVQWQPSLQSRQRLLERGDI